MSDDIVAVLRAKCKCWQDDKCTTCFAIDEIERLRATLKKAEVVLLEGAELVKDALADRDRWKNWAEEYFYTDPDCECPLCDKVKAAINNG